MSDLIVVAFPGEDTADQVLNKLQALQKEHLIDLEDACVVVRDRNGKVHVKQAVNLVGLEAASGGAFGAFWGTLIGLLFLNPLAGLFTGAAFGAGAGRCRGCCRIMASMTISSGPWARPLSPAPRRSSSWCGALRWTRSCPRCGRSAGR